MRRYRLQIVDVVEEHVFELRDGWIDIPRHGQIENAQRSPTAAGDDVTHTFPRDDRMRRGRRAERDVGRAKVCPRFLERHRAATQAFRDGPRALLRAVGDERDLYALVAQTGGCELSHIPGAENQRAATRQIAKNLSGDRHAG